MTQEWPTQYKFFTFNDVLLEAIAILPNGGRSWVASSHVEQPGRLEFYDMDDLFDSCVFYMQVTEAAKELGK